MPTDPTAAALPWRRTALAAAALVIAALVGAPTLGLLGAALDPPGDPLGGAAPGVMSSGAPRLLLNSALLALGTAALAMPLGTWLAWAGARLQFPGRRILGTLALLPMATPSYLLAATISQALGPGGWIGGPLGLPRPTGLPAAAVVMAAVTTPYVMLVVGAALHRQSAAEEEAARSLGAGPWRVFRVVTLPQIRPALGYSGLLVMLYALSDFGAVAVLDCPVLTWRLYQAVAGQDLGRAAMLGGATLAAALPLFAAARWVRGAGSARGAANPRPPAPRRPGPLALAGTWGGLALLIGLGVALPAATMGAWVWDGLRRGLPFASPWLPLLHTVGAALAGAALTWLLALAPAWSAGPGRIGRMIDQGAYLTSALPGVLLAFGWTLAALAVARLGGGRELYAALTGSGLLLMLGYATRFLAEVYTPLRTAALQLDARQLESARALGAPPSRWLRHVAAPALAPGAAAAALLGFIAILKELPVTLLLGGPTGLRTLAFRVWDRYSEALWHDAGLAGLILMGLALAAALASLKWRRHA